jgi:hypothetical protein
LFIADLRELDQRLSLQILAPRNLQRSSFQLKLEAFCNSEAGHPVTSVFIYALPSGCSPARRAFRPSADGRVTFLCVPKEK